MGENPKDNQADDSSHKRADPPPSKPPVALQPEEKPPQTAPDGHPQKPDNLPKKPENPPDSPPRRRRWPWILAVILVILAILGLRRCSTSNVPRPTSKAPAGAAITTGESTTGDINVYITALGTVTPVYTVTVYSQITGIVTSVHYQQGQLVKKGDPLVDIDPRPYQATLTQAEGNLAHDQGLLDEAIMDLHRYQAAAARNAIARQQLEDQEKIVIQDQGTVKSDQGAVDYDRTELSYCHIVSPITGRVGLRLVDPGNTVFAGSSSTLVVITQLQPITVVFNVSEDDLPQVQAQLHGGRKLQVAAFDRSDQKQVASGSLTSLDNEVDTTTGTIKFRADFPNRDLSLFPNQFVNARLLVKTLRKVTLVPSAAIQYNGTDAFVYIVKPDNTVAVQSITVQTGNNQVTAVEGINAGVTVATSGFDRLENGAHVMIRNQNPAQNATHPSQNTQNPGQKKPSPSQKKQGPGGTVSP
jgi:membrane fusion protein, multidrug efflux system